MRRDNRNSGMGDSRNSGRGGGRNFSGRQFGGGQSFGPRTMHQAVCSECGKDCEVPFKPTGDKPVYCSNCFSGRKSGDSHVISRAQRSPDSSQYKEQLSEISRKLGEILEVLRSTKTVKTEVVKKSAEKSVVAVSAKKTGKKAKVVSKKK